MNNLQRIVLVATAATILFSCNNGKPSKKAAEEAYTPNYKLHEENGVGTLTFDFFMDYSIGLGCCDLFDGEEIGLDSSQRAKLAQLCCDKNLLNTLLGELQSKRVVTVDHYLIVTDIVYQNSGRLMLKLADGLLVLELSKSEPFTYSKLYLDSELEIQLGNGSVFDNGVLMNGAVKRVGKID